MALPMIVAYINDSTCMTIPTESILSVNYTISEGAVKNLGKLVRVLAPFSSFVEDLTIYSQGSSLVAATSPPRANPF